MKTCIAIFALLLALADTARAHLGDNLIVAPILNNIAIDGDLSDWPAHMEEHYVLNHGQVYGATDIDTADLMASPDLTPKFKVGYSPTEQLLYVAATVRDDEHVLDLNSPPWGDNVEIYVDGDHNGGQYQPDRQIHQYVGLAGDIPISASSILGDNYYLFNHDIRKTRSLMAYDRSGDVTTYEWAIEVFDHLPHQPTQLAPGKTIGFDVAVVDKDDDGENSAWVSWGTPYAPYKVFNADLLGDLLLGEGTVADIENGGLIAGAATDADTGTPLAGLVLAAYQGDRQLSRARTDARGGFRFYLPSGTYALELQRGQGYRLEPISSTVEADRETAIDLSLTPIRLPAALEKSAALYAGLQSYGDSIEVEINAGLQGAAAAFAWQDSDRVRLESLDWDSGHGSAVYSDGLEQTWYEAQFQQYVQQDAGGWPRFADIPPIMTILTKGDPLILHP